MIDPRLPPLPLSEPPSSLRRPAEAINAELVEAARGFEALFLNQLLKSARAASFGEGLGESTGMDTTRTLMDQALSEAGAQRAGFGFAEAIHRQFTTRR
ncbi:MAG: rod-binding protein [Pseudomonadota bacterium]